MSDISKKRFFIPFLLMSCFVAMSNVLFRSDFVFSLFIVLCEIIVLVFLLINKKIKEYIYFYIAFISNCLEFSSAVGEETFYGLKNFRILGINLGALLLLPLVFFGIINFSNFLKAERNAKFKFVSILLFLNLIAAVTGLLLIVLNDNNIRSSFDNIFSLYVGKVYEMLLIPLALGLTLPLFARDSIFRIKLSLALEATLLASLFQVLISVIFKQYGSYSGVDVLQVSVVAFFIPLLMLTPLKKELFCFPRLCFVLSLIGSILTIFYNASGKSILLLGIVVLIYIFMTLKNGKLFEKILASIFIVLIIILTPVLFANLMNNVIFRSKIEQIQTMLNIFSSDWISKMSLSPRIRIEEFKSLLTEYSNKPLLSIFGKGFMGSITDNNHFFYKNVDISDSFVSEKEWATGIFYNLHEGSSILLMYGFFGFGFLILAFFKSLAAFFKSHNPFTLVGSLWLMFFYGYSFTLSIIGFSCVIYGLYYVSPAKQSLLKSVKKPNELLVANSSTM